jgi:negative regulator of genetic competence, sporulation and motility
MITSDEIVQVQDFRDEERQKFNESHMKLITQFSRYADVLTKPEEMKKQNEFEILFHYDKQFMDQIVDPSFKV